MGNERLLELAALQVQFEGVITRIDGDISRKKRVEFLTQLCAEFGCSFKEFTYLERVLIDEVTK